jgi:tRNA nucleotidyltransferase (CCA-adding enzyme)
MPLLVNSTSAAIKNVIEIFYGSCPELKIVVQAVINAGGTPVLVGGAVRDAFLCLVPKDFDVEVYNLSVDDLQKVLAQFGTVNVVGKSFGVLKLGSMPIDWSVPRFDSTGRKPEVCLDPYMDYHTSFARRDLTINAMGIDLITQELIDPFTGQEDLHNKILRAPVIERFIEDPLRLFRIMQFVARFDMQPNDILQHACKTMSIKDVALERIEQEYKKLFLFSAQPSKGLRWLQSIGRLQELLPELYATIGVIQGAHWHPEGDVFTHSLQALDAAVIIAEQQSLSEEKKLVLCCAALCHDLGKVSTTFEDKKGIHSYGHAEVGAPLAVKLLEKMFKNEILLKKAVYKLVYYHMMPGALVRGNARLSRYQHLAAKLAPEVTAEFLSFLCLADRQGRNPNSSLPLSHNDQEIDLFLQKITEAQVLHQPIPPLLKGSDLLSIVPPGKQIGTLLKKAYEIQIDENITDKDALKRKITKHTL